MLRLKDVKREVVKKSAFKIKPLVFILSTLVSCQAFALTPNDQPPLGKLPEWVLPTSYNLDFKIDPAKKEYEGTSHIQLKLTQPADHIWIHGQSLKVQNVTLQNEQGQQFKGQYAEVSNVDGVSQVKFDQVIPAGSYQMILNFSALYSEQLDGIYKIEFEGKPYVMTQMEAISARQSFPSFDEPRFKTPFNIRLTVPELLNAVANTQQIEEKKSEKGWKTLKFAQTKPLPTYLLALAVGPWQFKNSPDLAANTWRKTSTPLRGIAAAGKAEKMQHALSETPAIVNYLESYFNYGYVFDKLDLLAAPDFAPGAMENAGLITYRDFLMLLDQDSPVSFQQSSFNVNAHELAHQWTGDVVTMPWWDDLWLNESFATWMQSKVTQNIHPEFHEDLESLNSTAYAMSEDRLVSTRRIRQPILSNGDIQTAFDGITYEKGAAVLRMFERYLGENKFREGMRNYIKKHEFGNATAEDLINALSEQSSDQEQFKKAIRSFLDQPGVPLLRTQLNQVAGKTYLNVKQTRYFPIGSQGKSNSVWGIPLCIRYSTQDLKTNVQCELINKSEVNIELKGATANSWYIPNADAAGYYQYILAQDDYARLNASIQQLSAVEQLSYATAISAAYSKGEANLEQLLQVAKQLASSKRYQVQTALLSDFSYANKYIYKTDEQRVKFRNVLTELYLPKLEELGYQAKKGESQEDSLWRQQLINFLALDIKVPKVRKVLIEQSDAVVQQNKLALKQLTPDLLPIILTIQTQEKGEPVYQKLFKELDNNTEPTQRLAILKALGAVQQPELKEKSLALILNPKVKVGELRNLVGSIQNESENSKALWQWFIQNNEAVFTRLGKSSAKRYPSMFGGASCDQSSIDHLTQFFAPRKNELVGVERGLAQTVERIQLCKALVEKQKDHFIQ